jgi:antirestriction protein
VPNRKILRAGEVRPKQSPIMEDFIPRVYVGTYAKYNNGSIFGEWLEPAQYVDLNDFLAACAELHEDEDQPEFMFQDYENIPKGLISECSISADLWVFIEQTQDWDEDRMKAFQEFLEAGYGERLIESDLENFDNAYQGKYDSEEAFADNFAEEHGLYTSLDKIGINRHYFDLAAYTYDLFIDGFYFSKSYVFSRC